jgi:hypothetical protein
VKVPDMKSMIADVLSQQFQTQEQAVAYLVQRHGMSPENAMAAVKKYLE